MRDIVAARIGVKSAMAESRAKKVLELTEEPHAYADLLQPRQGAYAALDWRRRGHPAEPTATTGSLGQNYASRYAHHVTVCS